MTLGAVGKLTPDEARELARRAIGSIAHGQDPAAKQTSARKAMTVSELADLFLSEHIRGKRKAGTCKKYEHVLRKHILPQIGRERVNSITNNHMAQLHLKMRDIPATANYALAIVGSMFNFALRRGHAEGRNPISWIEKYPEKPRQRFLSLHELSRLGDALRDAEKGRIPWQVDESKSTARHLPKQEKRWTTFDPTAVAAVRLLLLTGCRLREILHLQWEYVDFERGMLHLPDSKTGPKHVVLSTVALDILTSLPRVGQFVVPGDDPSRPRHDLKRLWLAVTRQAQLPGVRIHDLRHTFASHGVGEGLGLPVIGKLLGHSQLATTQRYAHLDADPLRLASQRIGSTIEAALNGKATQSGL
jgi:integrase